MQPLQLVQPVTLVTRGLSGRSYGSTTTFVPTFTRL
jgi:hypothetical protein